MLEEYIYHGKEKLRCGYTTGSCATMASKASAEMLITGKKTENVSIITPKGIKIESEILDISMNSDYVSCAIKKDSGDDPDITNNIMIYARAEKTESGIEITGGEGVGIVTVNGLDQPSGEYAINSTPRKMIYEAVKGLIEYYSYNRGIKITVYVPEGRKTAEKTYNSRMGIINGISIIGTSGIVEPMSSKALIDTIRIEEKIKKTQGVKNLLLTLGNYGENFLLEKIPEISEKSVKCSNFIGDAIDMSLEYGFESVLIVGHIGKLVKLGAGIMNTHSSQADARIDVLISCGVTIGADIEILKKVSECVTTDEALEIFMKVGLFDGISKVLMKRIQYYLDMKVKGSIKTGAVVFSNKFGIIGMTEFAEDIIEKIRKE